MYIYSNYFSKITFFLKHFQESIKFLRDPHSEKIQKFKDRYQELEKLAEVATLIAIDG